MGHIVLPLVLLSGLFLAMVVLVEIGRRVGRGRTFESLTTVETSVFGLMGLLIAFTFGSAAVRFETRRSYVVQEANNIGTAYLRLDLLPADAQPALRDAFRKYVDTRLAIYRKLPDLDAAKAEVDRMAALQMEIWNGAIAASARSEMPVRLLLLPALNDMIDITTTRTTAIQMHTPAIIFVMLAVTMLACALLAGMDMSGSGLSWPHVLAFAAVLTIAFYVILDLEFPRVGLIRIDWMDQVLVGVRASMN
ncbi:MAG TPA: hypothetical protein VFV19_18075 [Candidatus Polarisedimenticolaceae bacterium]|nr:hypothetical protein [Candidatus Polarisedimenticolaceae bacterium]